MSTRVLRVAWWLYRRSHPVAVFADGKSAVYVNTGRSIAGR